MLVQTLTRHERAWPTDDPRGADWLPEPVTLAGALSRTWDDDRHMVQYEPLLSPSGKWSRVCKGSLATGAVVTMTRLVFDADDPAAHANKDTVTAASAEWRTSFEAAVPAGALFFHTFGGARLVYDLPDPVDLPDLAAAAEWSRYYVACCNALRRTTGLLVDASCKDFSRLFRLPLAQRVGKPAPTGSVPSQTTPLIWDDGILTDADWPAPSTPATGTTRRVDPAAAPAASRREELLRTWEEIWPPSQRHACSFALGGLLARGSWDEDTCMEFAEELLERTDSNVIDGTTCVRMSLENVGTGQSVYGIPELMRLCKPLADQEGPEGMVLPGRARLGMFLQSFVAAMQPPPTAATLPAQIAAVTAEVTGDTRDEDLKTWQFVLRRDGRGEIAPTNFNLRATLELHPEWKGVFGWDELARRVVVLRPGPTDTATSHVGSWNPDEGGTAAIQGWLSYFVRDFQKGMVIDMIEAVAHANSFHPVRKYLTELPAWDGVDRSLAGYLGAAPTAHHKAVCACWLRSAVARVMRPGCQADSLLILEGRQGARKSSALRVLAIRPEWFLAVRANLGSKDFLSNMRGKWIGEMAEIDRTIASREVSELKDLLTTTRDTYRAAYARLEGDYPRECVFAGTTNETDYLRDVTGNRRYWVVQCGSEIDVVGLERDRDQIWAQALAEYKAGEPWWLTAPAEVIAADEAEDRMEVDVWEEFMHSVFAEGKLSPQAGFTLAEALATLPGAIPGAHLDAKMSRRMGKTLRKMGFVRTRARVEAARAYLWKKG